MISTADITLDVVCPNCGTVSRETLSYDGVVEIEKRPMGDEKTHQWSETYKCPCCGNDWSVTHRKWEYPEGAINHEETKVVPF